MFGKPREPHLPYPSRPRPSEQSRRDAIHQLFVRDYCSLCGASVIERSLHFDFHKRVDA